MTATKTKRTVKPFKVTIDSPLVPRISVDVQAESAAEAREMVLGWIGEGLEVTQTTGPLGLNRG